MIFFFAAGVEVLQLFHLVDLLGAHEVLKVKKENLKFHNCIEGGYLNDFLFFIHR